MWAECGGSCTHLQSCLRSLADAEGNRPRGSAASKSGGLRQKSTATLQRADRMGYDCVKPMGTFYMLVRALGGNAKLFSDGAKRESLLIVSGDDFGCPEFFRLSTCVSTEMYREVFRYLKS